MHWRIRPALLFYKSYIIGAVALAWASLYMCPAESKKEKDSVYVERKMSTRTNFS